nr:RNA-directed DNA polymerase, eukaryota [Tanacetum cinerariifolium]
MGSYRSKDDKVLKIYTSIFVANFPDSFGAMDLWNTCKQYGQVVDAYISYRRSKAGKRSGFVRFIKVLDVDKLVNNLCTVWVGRHKLQANILRSQNSKMDSDLSPMMVLDDSCLNEKDYSLRLMDKVKDFATLANLKVVVSNEGFDNIKFKYMGGYWVMMEFQIELTELKFQENSVMKTWFSQIQLASSNFKTNGRVTWVEIEGKVFWVRAKEVPGWISDFMEDNDEDEDSKVGSYEEVPNGKDVKNVEDLEGDSDGEIVPYTKFEEDFPKQKGEEDSVGQGHFKKSEVPKSGGSLLQLIDNLVKVGETIGCWGKLVFDYVYSVSVGNSGGILCVWDPNMFKKTNSTVLDYFLMVRGDWMPNGKNLLIILVYAPQELSEKKMLWDYLSLMISNWEGEVVIMGDFNEVRNKSKRFGTLFNRHGADVFNRFISNAGLEEVPLEGCSFTWCYRSTTKMSKLYRFLISKSLLCACPNIFSITLDRYLSDHRPILMREVYYDYGPVPFRFFHYRFEVNSFDKFIEDSWKDAPIIESNALVRIMKKLKRTEVVKLLQEVEKKNSLEAAQKAKIKWAIEDDENSKYYHGVINKKSNQLSIRGILVEGTWTDSPSLVKNAVTCFFHQGSFPKGGNYSFICLIPKTPNANMVKDYKPISLNGSMYKIISKILANRLVVVLGGFVNEIQSTFVADKQILDGPFILNELVQWLDVGLFKGIELSPSLNLSHMFYADDAIFIGQWSESNIDTIVKVLDCFNRASGLRINMTKSKLLGIYVEDGSMPIYHISLFEVPKKKVKSSYPSLWLDIIHEVEMFKSRGIDLVSLIHSKLVNGANTSFWEVAWCGRSPIKSFFPRLYALETQKKIDVASKFSHSGLDVSFRCPPRGGVELQQFEHMKEKVEGCILADMMDRWFWALEGSGEITITSVRKMIDDFMLPKVSSKMRCIKAVPIKVNVHAWEVKVDGLPTRLNISRRGIDIESILCSMCGKEVESTSHIFFTCQMSKEILLKISRWWDIDYTEISSYGEWLDWILNTHLLIKSKQLFEGMCYVLWWYVWSFRNKTIFGSRIPSKAIIFDDVVSRSFYWCRYRCKVPFSWIEWLKKPHLISL